MRRLSVAALLLAAAAAGTFSIYARTLRYGFDYDDYHFVHPYTRAEVVRAFHGPWDPSGIERPYYRPLTIAFFAARYEMFGVDADAHHAVSLIFFAVAGALTGWFAYRLTGRAAGGMLAVLFFVIHPAMPYSQAAWVTNQMHLLETIVVLVALCWCDAARTRSAAWWTPVLILGAAAFLVKEDGIMLLPVLIAIHEIRRGLDDGRLPRVPWSVIGAAALVLGGLVLVRYGALNGAVSRRVPALETALTNYWAGLYRVFVLAPADRPWQRGASWFAITVPVIAVLMWRRARPGSRSLLASGLCMALLFNLPFVFVTKAEQLHLVATGASLVLTAGVLCALDAARPRKTRVALVLAAGAGAATLVAVTSDITRDFEPFGPLVLSNDDIVRGWAAVPLEVREYLRAKREPGAAERLSPNPARALQRITFGVHARETAPDGAGFAWMSGRRAEILTGPRVQVVMIPVRHAIEIVREPAHLTIESDGRTVDQVELTTAQWHSSQVAVGVRPSSWSGRMHRIVITTDRTWRPSDVIPGSGDGRLLGLQIGDIAMRVAPVVTSTGARR